jgi:hypothetical protein
MIQPELHKGPRLAMPAANQWGIEKARNIEETLIMGFRP